MVHIHKNVSDKMTKMLKCFQKTKHSQEIFKWMKTKVFLNQGWWNDVLMWWQNDGGMIPNPMWTDDRCQKFVETKPKMTKWVRYFFGRVTYSCSSFYLFWYFKFYLEIWTTCLAGIEFQNVWYSSNFSFVVLIFQRLTRCWCEQFRTLFARLNPFGLIFW